jgi:acylphosphatase
MESMYVIVRGLVQGVGFRYFVQQNARALGLVGYVKNLVNGDVEVFAQGEKEFLERFHTQLKHGPRSAQVRETRVTWKQIGMKYDEFKVAY